MKESRVRERSSVVRVPAVQATRDCQQSRDCTSPQSFATKQYNKKELIIIFFRNPSCEKITGKNMEEVGEDLVWQRKRRMKLRRRKRTKWKKKYEISFFC